MGKRSKVKTPDWIKAGYDSKEEYEKSKGKSAEKKKSGKTFKYRECPECSSDNVVVAVGEETKGKWKCNNCGWEGKDIIEKELSEEEFLKYLDEKGEEVA